MCRLWKKEKEEEVMIWWDWLAQGISVLAACCTIASFQCKNSSRLLFVQGILGSSLWMIHFAMLGSWSACLMNAVGVVRALFILRQYRTGKSAPYVKWLLCTMAMVSGVLGIFVNWNGNNPLLVAAPVWLWRLVIILLPFVYFCFASCCLLLFCFLLFIAVLLPVGLTIVILLSNTS